MAVPCGCNYAVTKSNKLGSLLNLSEEVSIKKKPARGQVFLLLLFNEELCKVPGVGMVDPFFHDPALESHIGVIVESGSPLTSLQKLLSHFLGLVFPGILEEGLLGNP